MITQEVYDKGLRCRGICSICKDNISCIQYINDVKDTKFDVPLVKDSSEKESVVLLDMLENKLRQLNISDLQFAELIIVWNMLDNKVATSWIDRHIK